MQKFKKLVFGAVIVICLSDLRSATAESFYYNRVSQVVEVSSGKFRDVFDVFSTATSNGFAQRLTEAPQGKEFDSGNARANSGASKIVFDTFRHREDSGNGNTSEIYIMDPDGSNKVRLTTNDAIDDAFPTWCNAYIVFARYANDTNQFDVYRMSASDADMDGNGDNLSPIIQTTADEFDPACSPDGRKIAFVKTVAAGDNKIVVANADGSNPVVLTSTTAICSAPRWSPDGQWIAYACDHHAPQTNISEIYRMRPVDVSPADGEGDDRVRETVSASGSFALSPSWSPNGTRLAFSIVTGPTHASYSKTIGIADEMAISGVDGRTFVTDWK